MKLEKNPNKIGTYNASLHNDNIENIVEPRCVDMLPLSGFALHDNKLTILLEENDNLRSTVIVMEPKDILKLDEWKLGQEKHTQEELTSLRKKVDGLNFSKLMQRPPRTDKDIENQKIVDGLLKHYSMVVTDLMDDPIVETQCVFIRSLIKETIDKDIADL